MPTPVEQLDDTGAVTLDFDRPITSDEYVGLFRQWLGADVEFPSRGRCVFEPEHGKKVVLLIKQITYLGNPHPTYKKRIQIPHSWPEYVNTNPGEDIRFIGVYRHDTTVLFVDFDKSKYMKRKAHNSSAHVFTNDLYQAFHSGIFRKTDNMGNVITVLRADNLRDYLESEAQEVYDPCLSGLREFNRSFPFGEWIASQDAYRELLDNESPDWAQGEWPGFWLENRMCRYTEDPSAQYHSIRFIKHKGHADLDFDLLFEDEDSTYYGDLKASNINKYEAPGNDKENVDNAISDGQRFWYVIYEHDTEPDMPPFEATRAYNEMKRANGKWPKNKAYDELSYSRKMKRRVRFCQMMVLELNESNRQHLLGLFSQGHQPGGNPRKPKYMIRKKDIDAFCVYRYAPDICDDKQTIQDFD